ncbi:MAG TPA: serpin family protein [bacterium]|nr:serpin family protein [bacterium]
MQLTKTQVRLVEADNHFGFDLFKEVTARGGEENMFISPLSVSMALGMTMNGAENATYDSLGNALGYADLSRQEINESYQDLMEQLTDLDAKVAMEIANAIWVRQGLPVEQEFIDVNTQYFDAEVTNLNFGDPGSVDIINNWVASSTHDKITRILDKIPPEMVMYLMNALYFKGDWTYQFDPEHTGQASFYPAQNTDIQCEMMSIEQEFPYFETDQFQAIDLPYGAGDFSMVILLPRQEYTRSRLIEDLDLDQWLSWMNQFQKREGTLRLPKFTLEYKMLLNDMLKALGMGIAFDPGRADFSGISQEVYDQGDRLYISEVLHKTFVRVDEQGTEAAAVTSVGVGVTSVQPDRFTMVVNRPFIFAIRERATNTILFLGSVVRPEWE